MNEFLAEHVEAFPWESEEQKKGYLNFVQYLAKAGREAVIPIDLLATYFIQKDHESNEWWTEIVASQVGAANEQIALLSKRVRHLEGLVAELLAKENPPASR